MDLRRFSTLLVLVLGVAMTSAALNALAAFTQPSSAPPNGNPDAPLSTGSAAQAKVGGLLLNTGGAANGLIVNSGNVGIDTATPAAALDVAGNIGVRGSSNYNWMLGTVTNWNTWDGNWGFGMSNSGSNFYPYARFYGTGDNTRGFEVVNGNGGSVPFFVGGSGNVGINNTNPAYTLDVAGNQRVVSGDNSYTYYGPNASWGGQLYVGASPNRSTTNTAQAIATDGNLHLDSGNNSKGVYIQYYSQNNTYINPLGGSVGIGNTSPGYKLDVSGYVRSNSGYVFPDGSTQTTAAISNGGTFANGPYTNDWFRVNGSGGIYWQTYGGGWQMIDSTWIRSYNGKPVYMSAGYDSGSPAGAGCSGGLGGGYTFQVCGSLLADIWYDRNNTGYYVDPNGNTNVNSFQAGGGSLLANWPGYPAGIQQTTGNYVYPGFVPGQGSGWNTSYYLAGSTAWGLYTNTSFESAGGLYDAGSRVITTANIGSQSVNYANSAGSASSANYANSAGSATVAQYATTAGASAQAWLTTQCGNSCGNSSCNVAPSGYVLYQCWVSPAQGLAYWQWHN